MSNTYPGGKMRLYQQLINLIPPHHTYIATHAGHDAIAQMKRPAQTNILIDPDPQVIAWWQARIASTTAGAIDGAGGAAAPSAAPLSARADNDLDSDTCRRASSLPAIAAVTITSVEAGQPRHEWRFHQVDATRWPEQREFIGDEFVYADPPYIIGTRSSGRRMYNCEMTSWDEHEALLKALLRLDCNVMISHYYRPLYLEMLGRWHWKTFRAIDRAGNEKTEYVWMNYAEPTELHDYRFLGEDYRERERVKRKKARWVRMWQGMPRLERQAILAAIQEANAG